jgi:hypothetical protein
VIKPPKPTASLVKKFLLAYEHRESDRLKDASLRLLFNSLCPSNNKIEHVLLKVSALNDFYGTNIYDTYSVARHILKTDVDKRLRKDDLSLVNDIANVSINGKTRRYYSFASKYCSFHKLDRYPIYDSFVEKMLMYYKKANDFDAFQKKDLKDYPRFATIIRNFQTSYELEEFSLREIDIFLWLAGKKWFPRSY